MRHPSRLEIQNTITQDPDHVRGTGNTSRVSYVRLCTFPA